MIVMIDFSITTTNGESFTYQDSCNLAFQIFRRFGRDMESAHRAWMRLLENNCRFSDFQKLVLTGKISFEE
jgi:hypothetical protein